MKPSEELTAPRVAPVQAAMFPGAAPSGRTACAVAMAPNPMTNTPKSRLLGGSGAFGAVQTPFRAENRDFGSSRRRDDLSPGIPVTYANRTRLRSDRYRRAGLALRETLEAPPQRHALLRDGHFPWNNLGTEESPLIFFDCHSTSMVSLDVSVAHLKTPVPSAARSGPQPRTSSFPSVLPDVADAHRLPVSREASFAMPRGFP
jgi:hypothetical protein